MVFRGSHNIGRTPGCLDWSHKTPARKIFKRSNFIKHIKLECHKIPENGRYYDPKAARLLAGGGAESTRAATTNLSQREFSSALAKAVVQDNYAMTFGEGRGMVNFFRLILPNIQRPSHQTLQRYLYWLFDLLGDKVTYSLKVSV